VPEALTVALDEGVPVALAEALDEGVPVALAEALDDGVPDALATPPPPLGDGGAVPLGDGVPDALGVALGVPDGLRSDAMPRPRYVKLATAASASPASHSSADSRTPLTMALDGTRCVTAAYRKHGDGADRKRRAVSARANAKPVQPAAAQHATRQASSVATHAPAPVSSSSAPPSGAPTRSVRGSSRKSDAAHAKPGVASAEGDGVGVAMTSAGGRQGSATDANANAAGTVA
jgi:hypothetical protein